MQVRQSLQDVFQTFIVLLWFKDAQVYFGFDEGRTGDALLIKTVLDKKKLKEKPPVTNAVY